MTMAGPVVNVSAMTIDIERLTDEVSTLLLVGGLLRLVHMDKGI